MIRVVLVDDQPLMRSGFRALLNLEGDIEVVGEAADGEEGVAVVRDLLPDVALVDIRMPGVDGIEATRRIAAAPGPDRTRVLVLTNYGFDEHVFEAMRAGAVGFLVKDVEPEDLCHGVRVAARGEAALAPSLTRRLIERFMAEPAAPGAGVGLEALTDRERQTVALVAQGLSDERIAARMAISPATAKTHANRAMVKLGARNRAGLVVIAYESGLVVPRGADRA